MDTALTVSPNFWYTVFSIFILTLWTTGCSEVLLSFQVFIDFFVFSLYHWFLGFSIPHFLWFPLFYLLRFVCGPGYSLCWCMFCEALKHMCILLLGGVFYKCWWNRIGSWCYRVILAGFLVNCSVVDRRMLRFPAVVLDFFICIFSPVRVWVMYFSALLFGTNTFRIACLSDGLILYITSFSLIAFFALKSTLSAINIAIPAFFGLVFAWHIFFHLFSLSLFVSLHLKWVSYRQNSWIMFLNLLC